MRASRKLLEISRSKASLASLIPTARHRAHRAKADQAEPSWFLPSLDEGDDEASRVGRKQQSRSTPTRPRSRSTRTHLECPFDGTSVAAYHLAASPSRLGQGRRTLPGAGCAAPIAPTPGSSPENRRRSWPSPTACRRSPHERREARERAGLPAGFRTRCSRSNSRSAPASPPTHAADLDLILHLIAAHHGYARPFAPVVLDDDPPDVEYEGAVLVFSRPQSASPAPSRFRGRRPLLVAHPPLRLVGPCLHRSIPSPRRPAGQRGGGVGKYDNEETPELAENNA